MRVALALVLMVTTPGCALLASANVSHNSRGKDCVESPVPATIDLVLAAGITGALAGGGALDHSAAWMLIPGVFVTSGVVGAIFAAKCGSKNTASTRGEYDIPVSAPYKLPENASDPAVPNATVEDLGTPRPETPAPPPPKVKLTLDPDYKLKDPPPKPPDKSGPIECDVSAKQCPPNHGCSLGSNGRGTCIKNKDR